MNILLLDENIYYCKILMNSMSVLNKEIRISFIANSVEDLSYIYDIDVILADYSFYGKDLENKFKECKVIYLTEDDKNKFAISKENIDLIIKSIETISNKLSEKYIDNRFYSELILLGYDISHLGTKCILEALKVMYYSDNLLLEKSLASNIYPILAEKFGITVSLVKSNVNYATARMLKNNKNKDMINTFNSKPSNKIGVKSVLHHIIQRVKYSN